LGDERIDLLEEEVRRLRRESKAAREAQTVAIDKTKQERNRVVRAIDAEHRAFRIAEHERDRAVAAGKRSTSCGMRSAGFERIWTSDGSASSWRT
jgi:hypothetical protein